MTHSYYFYPTMAAVQSSWQKMVGRSTIRIVPGMIERLQRVMWKTYVLVMRKLFNPTTKPWANVSNTPFRKFKHYVHEGGISTPFIAHWPAQIQPAQSMHEPCHVVDILPTILEATGSPYLSELNGHEIQPLQGESLLGQLRGQAWQRQQPIFWEHEGNSAIRLGQFKLVRTHGSPWELYDMEVDRTELHDLAGKTSAAGDRSAETIPSLGSNNRHPGVGAIVANFAASMESYVRRWVKRTSNFCGRPEDEPSSGTEIILCRI